jgi:phosphodiesterase/alkaline phosphatase D-like protein
MWQNQNNGMISPKQRVIWIFQLEIFQNYIFIHHDKHDSWMLGSMKWSKSRKI